MQVVIALPAFEAIHAWATQEDIGAVSAESALESLQVPARSEPDDVGARPSPHVIAACK